MFPNVRLMTASTIVSVMALFFAFGVYASLRVSHAPLARSSRAVSWRASHTIRFGSACIYARAPDGYLHPLNHWP